MERKICFDRATLDNKILVDDDKYLVMPAVIASEIIHQYPEGWAYKPADELEKMAKIANDIGTVPIKILQHPGSETYDLLLKPQDVHGRAENFRFVKNLTDPKTKRPMRRGVRADMRWFKDRVPENIINQIKDSSLNNVSIGFTFDHDPTEGDWNGNHYNFIQRNMYLQHVAAPIEQGRCPGPVCGIGVDSLVNIAVDPFGEYKDVADCVAKNQDKNDPEAYCATIKRKIEGESDEEKQCSICQEIKRVGLVRASYRLAQSFGKDNVVQIIKGKTLKKKGPESTESILMDAKKTIESARWLFEK